MTDKLAPKNKPPERRQQQRKVADFDAARDTLPRYRIEAHRPGVPREDPEHPDYKATFASYSTVPRHVTLAMPTLVDRGPDAHPLYAEARVMLSQRELEALRDELNATLAWLTEPYEGDTPPVEVDPSLPPPLFDTEQENTP